MARARFTAPYIGASCRPSSIQVLLADPRSNIGAITSIMCSGSKLPAGSLDDRDDLLHGDAIGRHEGLHNGVSEQIGKMLSAAF